MSLDPSKVQAASNEVCKALDNLIRIEVLSRPIPTELYHYTSAVGIKGIIESGSLWATNILYLNDSSELSYATAMLQRVFEAEAVNHTGCVQALLSLFIPRLVETIPRDFFVACFCESSDLLSQWRAYAAKGTGYCLGFKTDDVLLPKSCANHVVSFQKVEYDVRQQETLLRQRLDALLQVASPLFSKVNLDASTADSLRQFSAPVIGALCGLLTSLKHPAFAEEKEWRIVSFGARPTAGLNLRIGANGLVPYIDLTFPKGSSPIPLTTVRHGPVSNPVLTKKSIKDLLLKHGYDGVPVDGSDVPLRDV